MLSASLGAEAHTTFWGGRTGGVAASPAQPNVVLVADVRACSPGEQLSAYSLEGLFNGTHARTRIYEVTSSTDLVWARTALPRIPGTTVHWLMNPLAQPACNFGALLRVAESPGFRVIITDPQISATIDIATTLAGLDHAVVVTPAVLSRLQDFTPRVVADLRAHHWNTDRQADSWEVQTLLPNHRFSYPIVLSPHIVTGLRDYAVTTHSFVFDFGTKRPWARRLFGEVMAAFPPNTPVLGYVKHEAQDVAAISQSSLGTS